ncbi:helix-turn-helix domain-containing protein [Salinicoccus albus]|uniref:helix-turn-helix domain-containing protein n=1 Tax=Salinicoccus albus TaxID=418756 RepID=UPI00037AAF59|nr:helix-turn-helix domain-containing protein [Salinicoccus albus]
MEYHERFKAIRNLKGFTHKDLSEGICGMTTIYRFERGDTAITAEVLYQLCQRLGIDMQTLFVDEGSEYALIDYYLEKLREYVYFRHPDMLKMTLQDAKETINNNLKFDLKYKNYDRLFDTYSAIVYRNENKYDTAEKILVRLIEEKKNKADLELEIINSLADLYISQDKQSQALGLYERYRKNIMNYEKVTYFDQYMLIQLYYGYANCLYIDFEYLKAMDVCYKLLIRIQEHNSMYYLGKSHHLMSLIFIALNDSANAREYLKKAEAAFCLEDIAEKMRPHLETAKEAIDRLEHHQQQQ